MKLSLTADDPNTEIDALQDELTRQMKSGKSLIIVDLARADFPSGSFVAMLVGMTFNARRRGVDIQLINVSDTARSHFAMFSPLAYLSIGMDVMATAPAGIKDNVKDFSEGVMARVELEAVVDELGTATEFVVARAEKAGFEKIELSKFKIAVYEACMNIIEHGYNFDPGHAMTIELFWDKDRFEVTLKDQGKSFDIYNRRDYNVDEAFQEGRDGGFGLFIIERSVDEIHYSSDPVSGNSLTLVKYITGKGK